MDKKILEDPWIKLRGHMTAEEHSKIYALQMQCQEIDSISLKLELDYKLNSSSLVVSRELMKDINEMMFFDGDILIGYLGISDFSNGAAPFEISGMVHPSFRRLGVFSTLFNFVEVECKRRGKKEILVLCDRNSGSGQEVLRRLGGVYKNSEFEMHCVITAEREIRETQKEIFLRKATNADAEELVRQNKLYFDLQEEAEGRLLPEEEEKRGMTTYLAYKGENIIGKINVQCIRSIGGIYGLGLLPEFRGRGYGRAILAEGLRKLNDLGAKETILQVSAENETALNLYHSCGFKIVSTMDYFTVCF